MKRRRARAACGVKRTGRQWVDLFLVEQTSVDLCCWKVREEVQHFPTFTCPSPGRTLVAVSKLASLNKMIWTFGDVHFGSGE